MMVDIIRTSVQHWRNQTSSILLRRASDKVSVDEGKFYVPFLNFAPPLADCRIVAIHLLSSLYFQFVQLDLSISSCLWIYQSAHASLVLANLLLASLLIIIISPPPLLSFRIIVIVVHPGDLRLSGYEH